LKRMHLTASVRFKLNAVAALRRNHEGKVVNVMHMRAVTNLVASFLDCILVLMYLHISAKCKRYYSALVFLSVGVDVLPHEFDERSKHITYDANLARPNLELAYLRAGIRYVVAKIRTAANLMNILWTAVKFERMGKQFRLCV
jgi:hypothetical protein